jgi:hypothetical protein
MNKNILVFGLIAGLVVSCPMLLATSFFQKPDGSMDYDKGVVIGYTSMLLAFSMVYVGIYNYRNKYNNGVISFGKAFKIGAAIVFIASTIYVVSWLINYFYFIPNFLEDYTAHTLAKMREKGASQFEIDEMSKEMAHFAQLYKNPFFNAMMTYMEILPVGLGVTLISALILKKKQIN